MTGKMQDTNKESQGKQSTDRQGAGMAMKQLQDAGLGPLGWLGTTWFEAMIDINSEVIDFIADRIKEDVKTQHEFLHCKEPAALQKAQMAFLERAYVQYTTEAGKLLKMGTDLFPSVTTKTKGTPL